MFQVNDINSNVFVESGYQCSQLLMMFMKYKKKTIYYIIRKQIKNRK